MLNYKIGLGLKKIISLFCNLSNLQVIRRGDRRPFYAPARYVMEVKGEEGEWDSIWGGESVHYRPDNGEPIPSRMDQYHDRKSQFSTFLGAPHHPHPLSLNNANKRSSYAPPGTHTTHGPQSSDFLFGAPRFQERYRSNSMDSILVQDMSRQVFQPVPHDKIPHGVRHFGVGPPLLIPTQGPPIGLEKRPTFDNIDKRASWSTDKSLGYPGPYPGHHPVYPGPVLMQPATLPHNLPPHQSKKPIPLPRSKIPVATKSATIERSAVQPEMRTFKRSKTDLSLNMLSSYKAGRGIGASNSNKNGPLNFGKSSSNPPKQQKSAQLRSRPSNRSNRPAVISEESHRPSNSSDDNKQTESLLITEKHLFNKFKMNKVSNNNKNRDNNGVTVSSKPALREKPSIANVNHNKSAANLIDKKTNAALISRHRSESDLLKIDTDRSRVLQDNIFRVDTKTVVEDDEPVNGSDMKISLKVEAQLDKRRSFENNMKKSESKENIESAVVQNNTALISNDINIKKKNNRKVTNEKFLDEDTLPEPPPTPPDMKKSSEEEVSEGSSKPLIISTEPMSVSSCSNNKSEDKSNCSSYDSLDGSLDSTVSQEWPEGGDWLGTEPSRDAVKSPNSSTCSRSPPTPTPDTCPVRHVMQDWDEFLDVSGRKYYYNSKTHEKSWKPPRKPRCSSDGYSAPTSPDPCTDQSFDMITEFTPAQSASDEPDNAVSIDDETSIANLNNFEVTKSDPVKNESLDNLKNTSVESGSTLDNGVIDEIPTGYEVKYENGDDGEMYYVNVFTGVAWYTARDKFGRIYYYEENGNESCWTLPSVSQTIQDHSVNPSPVPEKSLKESEKMPILATARRDGEKMNLKDDEFEHSKTENLRHKFYHSNSNIQIGDVSINVVKQGPLNKTKITENGKKYRKNWAISNIVLTDTFLLFFKDSKSFLEKGNKPDHCVDLKGANIEWCNSDKSKRSNVFEVSTFMEQKLLMQDDDFTIANDWFCQIENVIVALTQRELVNRDEDQRSLLDSASSTLKSNKGGKISRTKSLKLKLLNSSEELLNKDSPDSPSVVNVPLVKEKSRIREKLRRFFMRRPNVEELMKRGIIKNEPVFGTTLQLLAKSDQCEIPVFVRKCISVIESKPEYLKTDGVYRQSGNLSVVQKIRLQIDQGNFSVLETVDDVHVLTGALKLFFRELKEPLIPWEAVEKLLPAINLPSKKGKLKTIKEIITKMSGTHHATLFFLLKHLEKVTNFKDVNRMAAANLAIVFGPTLMWPPTHLTTTNMALNMMQQNMIVEALITNLSQIS